MSAVDIKLSENQWRFLPKEFYQFVTHKEQVDTFMEKCGCIPFFFEVYNEVER